MRLVFISDLHLSGTRPQLTRLFLDFLDRQVLQPHTEALYILGDLFDAWIGDDALDECAGTLIPALKALHAQGCQLFIQHGNRDFLLGETFAKACKAQLLDEIKLLEVAGQKTLLMHGDLLCTDDHDYQQARKKLRHPDFIADFLARPIQERLALAQGYRQQSNEATSGKEAEIMDVNPETVLEYMDRYQVQTLIHGHTHRPGITALPPDGRRMRYCLSDWSPSGTRYLTANSEQGLVLRSFPES